jgi:HK97 family phage prohead protease
MSTLYTKAEIKEKADDYFTAVASSEVEDRQGEVVKQSGWSLTNFKKNPILLWMHDHEKPLGKAERVWLDKTGKSPVLKFKGIISTATEYGRAAKQLMEEGILNSFSVGFRALEMDGNAITKAELFEISLVSVPANPEARLLAAKSLEGAGFKESVIKNVIGESDENIAELKEQIAELKKEASEAKALAEDAVKGLQHLAPLGSRPEVVSKRLQSVKLLAKTADILIVESKSPKTVDRAKLMKRTSEKLISNLKGDL